MTSILRRAIGRLGANGSAGDGSRDSEHVDALIAGREPLEAVEVLTEANRAQRDPEIERRLVRLRHEAFAQLDRSPPASPAPEMMTEVPPSAAGSFTIVDGLPEVPATALTAEAIRAGLLSHGSLVVRGLISSDRAAAMRDGIDRAFEARDRRVDGAPLSETSPWFEPYDPGPEYPKFKLTAPNPNRVKRGGGAAWAPDSPRMLFELIEAFGVARVGELAAEYLGERPALSLQKSVLRRVPPTTDTGWHQDGAFMGEGIRTLNVWIALSACGEDAPGLDLVPKRVGLVETGTGGTYFPWGSSPKVVEELLEGHKPAQPVFAPGDAILFDHLCLHQTGVAPGMTKDRYAAETWCFAPSAYPEGRVPLVL